jgi:hypothetical protein
LNPDISKEGKMKQTISLSAGRGFLAIVLITGIWLGGSFFLPDSPPAFGGAFPGQMAPQGAKYQIAGCDANSAWVIDVQMGDVYLIYANGKWKEVGSILDEKKRIKTKP